MKLIQTAIPDVVLIEPAIYEDDRGWFMESFNERKFHEELKRINLPKPASFVQDNYSFSKRGVLRGLHYQLAPYAQGKLVRVFKGCAFDVVVDIRPSSKTFGRWVGFKLSDKNNLALWVPPGFAHGFLALEDDTGFFYKCTSYYDKCSERTIAWNDSSVRIDWPLAGIVAPLVSDKDMLGVPLDSAELSSV